MKQKYYFSITARPILKIKFDDKIIAMTVSEHYISIYHRHRYKNHKIYHGLPDCI